MSHDFLKVLNDPHSQADALRNMLISEPGTFVFCFGSTETSEIEGVSAAGITAAARRLTPSIDADVLFSGHPRGDESIPVSPVGISSPVVITRACLKLLEATPVIVDCGTFRAPLFSDLTAGTLVARSVSTGCALSYKNAENLYYAGCKFATEALLKNPSYIIFSECVPGGTTTAMAVLRASGIDADNLVSSSLPQAGSLRVSIVKEGLANAQLNFDKPGGVYNPLEIIAAVGDPMQPFVIGAALTASKKVPVILGGGSQMLAVYHMCKLFSEFEQTRFASEKIFVITTKWISNDGNSNTRHLSQILRAPFFASAPDFNISRFPGLQAYEQGHVKEGVGAGALMAAAYFSRQLSRAELTQAIDDCYAEIVLPTSVPQA